MKNTTSFCKNNGWNKTCRTCQQKGDYSLRENKNKAAWYEAGMVPPSFANNINYHNEMKIVHNTERGRNGLSTK